MPTYAYRATDEHGRIVDGHLEAKNKEAVIDRLHRLAFYPLEIKDAESGAEPSGRLGWRPRKGKRVAYFISQLATLLEAGLPVDRSLAIAEELTEEKDFAETIGRVRKAVEEGSTLADGLALEEGTFSPLAVNMVRAGESGGALEVILRRLADYLEESQRLKDFILSALAYPVFLIFFAVMVLTVIFISVLPRFARVFTDMGDVVPAPAMMLMSVSRFVGRTWWLAPLALGLIFAALRAWLATADGRFRWDRSRLSWPLLGRLMTKIETARFARTLGTLLASGVPVLQSVDIVGATVGNTYMASFMADIKSGLKKGEGLVTPLRRAKIFPALFVHMVTVGEETGRLEEMLVKVAAIFEREVESATKAMLSLLEPLIIVVLGIVLGGIVVTILWAIFSVYQITL